MDQETIDKMCNDCQDALDNALNTLYHNHEHIKADFQELERKIKAAESVKVSIINNPHEMCPDPLTFDGLHTLIQQSETFFAKYKQYANQVELLYEKAKPEIRKSIEV